MSKAVSVVTVLILVALPAQGALIEFTDKAEWQSAVDNFSTITFTEFPAATPITDHYEYLGISFLTLNFILESSGFVNDLWGLHGPNGIHFSFHSPQNWVGVDHPGDLQFQLFYEGALVATTDFPFVPGGTGKFAGVVSSVAFDEVYVFKPQPPFSNNIIFIDDLHWGAIPSPGALGLFAIAALGARRRRR